MTKTQGFKKKRTGKDKLVQIVDSEISFNFKPNLAKRTKSDCSIDPTPLVTTNNNVEKTPTTVSEKKPEIVEFVDDEISFNFNTPKKTEPGGSEIKTEKEIEWLKTMVIIYDIIFDIKTEKKDDYEDKVKFPKKKKKRRRFGRYWQNWKIKENFTNLANYHTPISGFKNITNFNIV